MAEVIVATGYGDPDVLALVEVADAPPGPGEVVIDVRAAGVNPADWKSYSGMWGTDASRLPIRLGFEVAGVVTALGPGDPARPAGSGDAGDAGSDRPLALGDEVIGYRVTGGYATRLTVPGDALVRRPANLPAVEAAGLLLTAATAFHAVSVVEVAAGETVLIHAAAGGVGLHAVRLAVQRGARVIGTASPRRHDALRAAGAVPVAYGDGLLERVREAAGGDGLPGGVDAVVDAVVDAAGTDEALEVSLAVAAADRIATVANFGPRAAQAGIRRLGAGPGADPGTELRQAARPELVRLAEAGVLRVPVAETFPLARAAEAHRLVRTGHVEGKVVLTNEP